MTPRFVPFESMSDAEQREHLRRVHYVNEVRLTTTAERQSFHYYEHRVALSNLANLPLMPHTHDKPARTAHEARRHG